MVLELDRVDSSDMFLGEWISNTVLLKIYGSFV